MSDKSLNNMIRSVMNATHKTRHMKTVNESYFYEKDDEDHNPVDHVKEKEDGTFCVYDIEGNIVAEFDEEEDAIGYAIKNHDDLMGIDESRHKKSKNREFMDKFRNKGKVAPIDRERYPNRERQGLEGPYRSRKSGRIYYYDKKAGEFYDPDTDIYLQVDDVE